MSCKPQPNLLKKQGGYNKTQELWKLKRYCLKVLSKVLSNSVVQKYLLLDHEQITYKRQFFSFANQNLFIFILNYSIEDILNEYFSFSKKILEYVQIKSIYKKYLRQVNSMKNNQKSQVYLSCDSDHPKMPKNKQTPFKKFINVYQTKGYQLTPGDCKSAYISQHLSIQNIQQSQIKQTEQISNDILISSDRFTSQNTSNQIENLSFIQKNNHSLLRDIQNQDALLLKQMKNSRLWSLKVIQTSIKGGLKQIHQTDKAAIIIGDTGQGKSSLLNFIASNPLISQYLKPQKNFIIKAVAPLGNIEIGQGFLSKTTLPNKWIDPNGVVYWDCPGFNDSKGVEQDITNGFYIKRIFETARQVKIIVVVSQNSICGRGSQFLGVLKKLENLFVDLDLILESICLVLTQTSFEKTQDVQQYISKKFLPSKQYLSKNQLNFCKHFSNGEGQIALFKLPQKQGPIDMSQAQDIRDTIGFTKYIKKPSIRITVSSDSLLALQTFAQIINGEITKICQSTNQMFEKICQKIINEGFDYQYVNKQLSQLEARFKVLKNPNETQNFVTNFVELLKRLKIDPKLIEDFQAYFKLLEFIRQIKPQTVISNHKWISNILADDLITKLAEKPQVIISQDLSILTIKCYIIGVKQISNIISKNNPDTVQHVHIFCFHTFYVDSNLLAPGVSFAVLAKNWKISKNQKFMLNGLNAQKLKNHAAHAEGVCENGFGLKGYDGQPGIPGQTGGSFLGKIMSQNPIFGPGILQIDVRGGKGGNGQDGGNGSNGLDGKDAQKQPVINRKQQYLVSRQQYNPDQELDSQKITRVIKAAGTFNKQMIQTYISEGKNGRRGGDPGKGGVGGFGGQSGVVRLENFTAKVIRGSGQSGQSGKSGRPGKGGKNGKTYKGQYVNELMFGSFRDEGKLIENKCVVAPNQNKSLKQVIGDIAPAIISTLGSGIVTLGLGLITQTAVSAYSADLCSKWLNKDYQDNGYAPNGQTIFEKNIDNIKQPNQYFQIKDSYVMKLQMQYENYRTDFLISMLYETRFFD